MAKKTDKKETTEKIEREYTIPLRAEFRKVARYKRAAKAIRAIKEFLVQHMKIRDRDLNKIKIDRYLNEYVWFRGIRKPPAKIKVKAIKEGDVVRVELAELPETLRFKKEKEEKREKKAVDEAKIKKKPEKVVEESADAKTEGEAEKETEAEKKAAVAEEVQKLEKAKAKESKHMAGGKTKEPKHKKRQVLSK